MKNKTLIIGIIVVVVIVAIYLIFIMDTTPEGDEIGYMDLSAAEAKQLIDENPDLIIIDVSPHYDNGHIPGAINYYPFSVLQEAIPSLDKNAKYLIYCHADGPSRNGAQAFIDAGFMNVYRLESHFGGWQDAGYEVEQ